MTDANTAALIDHQRREDRTAQRRAELVPIARARLEDRIEGPAFSSDGLEFLIDALASASESELQQLAVALRTEDTCEAGRIIRRLWGRAKGEYVAHMLPKEIDRLDN
jgi:hypothetical protein